MVKITFFHPRGDEGRQYASEPSQFFEYILSKLFYTISPMVGSFLKFSCLCPVGSLSLAEIANRAEA